MQTEILNIPSNNTVNVDEVSVLFDVVYEQKVKIRGQDNVNISFTGHEKSNFTVVFATTAAGNKLKTMII